MTSFLSKLFNNQIGAGGLNLIISTAIIGSTASVGLAHSDGILISARDTRRQMDMHQTHVALELYLLEHNQYPMVQYGPNPTTFGWQELQTMLTAETQGGPWISEPIFDPVNDNGYAYRYWSDGANFIINYTLEETGEQKTLRSL